MEVVIFTKHPGTIHTNMFNLDFNGNSSAPNYATRVLRNHYFMVAVFAEIDPEDLVGAVYHSKDGTVLIDKLYKPKRDLSLAYLAAGSIAGYLFNSPKEDFNEIPKNSPSY